MVAATATLETSAQVGLIKKVLHSVSHDHRQLPLP